MKRSRPEQPSDIASDITGGIAEESNIRKDYIVTAVTNRFTYRPILRDEIVKLWERVMPEIFGETTLCNRRGKVPLLHFQWRNEAMTKGIMTSIPAYLLHDMGTCSGNKYYVAPFSISKKMDDGIIRGHSLSFIYDGNMKTAFLWDPNGCSTFGETHEHYIMMRDVIKKKLYPAVEVVVTPDQFGCSNQGPQECASEDRPNVETGTCTLWSFYYTFLFLHFANKFPDISVDDLLHFVNSKLQKYMDRNLSFHLLNAFHVKLRQYFPNL